MADLPDDIRRALLSGDRNELDAIIRTKVTPLVSIIPPWKDEPSIGYKCPIKIREWAIDLAVERMSRELIALKDHGLQ